MSFLNRFLFRKSVLLALLLSAPNLFAQPKYTIQDLGSLAGAPACAATAISPSGQVTGYCTAAGGSPVSASPTRAFVYSNGVMKDLGQSPQPTVVPTAINDSGLIAGTFININLFSGFTVAPFVYQNGSIQTLAGVPSDFVPFGLTNSGQIAGTRVTVQGTNVNSFYFHSQALSVPAPGSQSTVLPPQSGTQGAAFGLSRNGGWVAGGSIDPAAAFVKPTLWHNGNPQALPVLTGFQSGGAISVNDSGMAAGMAFNYDLTLSSDPNAAAHAVFFNNGAITDLGVLAGDKSSMALSINNSSSITGFSSALIPQLGLQLVALLYPASSNYHAFIYTNGTLYDLNKLVTVGAGWQLCFANAINDAGQIVGTGLFQGQQRAFLLTPVSTPQITAVVGGGLSVPSVTNISANGILTIYGNAFTPSGVSRNVSGSDLVNNSLPTNLANTCVQSGNTRWSLYYVSAGQINALAGPLPASGTVPVSVIANCGAASEIASASFNVPVAAQSPEFFYFVQRPNGQNPVAALFALSGAYAGPPGLIPGATFTPAHVDDVLTVFGTGWGPTDPPAVIGTLASGAASITGQYSLTVGNVQANVSYAGLSPTFAGLYQINFVVPQVPAGNQPIVLTVNGVASPLGAFLTIGQ